MAGPKAGATGGTNGMVFMCTSVNPEKKQNELYLAAQALNAAFLRDKTNNAFDFKTTHLVVGDLSKTEKFLCGLAAGIAMVGVEFIWDSKDQGRWLQDDIEQFDIGNPNHPLRRKNKNKKFFIPTLPARQNVKAIGGTFRDWHAVVLIDDARKQEIYRRLLTIGGAKVERWTIQHLRDLPVSKLQSVTHIISHPDMLSNQAFLEFLAHNKRTANVPVVAYIYVGDYLTREFSPTLEDYDVRMPGIIQILCSGQNKEELLKAPRLEESSANLARTYSQPICVDLDDGGINDDIGGVDEDHDDDIDTLPVETNVREVNGRSTKEKSISEVKRTTKEKVTFNNVASTSSGSIKNKEKVATESPESPDTNKEDDDILIVGVRESARKQQADILKAKAKMFRERDKVKTSQTTMDRYLSPKPRPSQPARVPDPPTEDDDEITVVKHVETSILRRDKDQEVIDINEPGSSQGESSKKRRRSNRISSRGEGDRKRSHPSSSPHEILSPESPEPNNKRKKTSNNNNSFLSLKRSVSIAIKPVQVSNSESSPVLLSKKSSRLSLSRQGSSTSSSSCSVSRQVLQRQDSFAMESDDSPRAVPVDNSPAGRLQFCNNLFSFHRAAAVGLDIGNGGATLNNDLANEGGDVEMEPLSAAMVNNIWTCLDDGGSASIQVNEGWMFALSLLRSVVSRRRYPPLQVINKIFTVALKDKREEVRLSAYSTMYEVMQLYQPGPANRIYYLHLISSGELDKPNWEFNMKEPWEFLVNVVDECMAANLQENASVSSDSEVIPWSEKDQSGGPNGSWSLTLRLITELLEMDLKKWFEGLLEMDVVEEMTWTNRPLVASVVWPGEMIEWTKRLEKLCTWYVGGVGGSLLEQDLESVRKLVGLGAQILQMKERSKGMSQCNTNKTEMAMCIAREMNRITIPSEDLWTELYLLEPAWLSALVSAELLAKQTNKTTALVPTLRSVVDTYVNVEVDVQELDLNRSVKSSSRKIASPRKVPSSIQDPSPRKPLLPRNTPVTPQPSSKKMSAAARNKYGETKLHKLCKKGDVARIVECLSSPGVDINSRDNNGWTPLHEAVLAGSVAAVELLVNHTTNNLHKYFKCESPRKVSSKVDLLAVGGDDKMNAFHEAVNNNNFEIVKILLSVAGKPGFPSVQELMSSQTGEGSVALDLCISPEMTDLLQGTRQVEESKDVSLRVLDAEKFSAVLQVAVSKYIAANCLASIYDVLTPKVNDQFTLDVDKVIQGDSKVPPGFKKYGLVSLADGLKTSQFGVKPMFDIFRDDTVKAQDLRDYEKLLFPKKFVKMPADHPIVNQLKLMKITKLK